MTINDMELIIKKTWYNKSKVGEDGITHTVDTEHQYPVYQFGMAKNYFDYDNREQVLNELIADLRRCCRAFEKNER